MSVSHSATQQWESQTFVISSRLSFSCATTQLWESHTSLLTTTIFILQSVPYAVRPAFHFCQIVLKEKFLPLQCAQVSTVIDLSNFLGAKKLKCIHQSLVWSALTMNLSILRILMVNTAVWKLVHLLLHYQLNRIDSVEIREDGSNYLRHAYTSFTIAYRRDWWPFVIGNSHVTAPELGNLVMTDYDKILENILHDVPKPILNHLRKMHSSKHTMSRFIDNGKCMVVSIPCQIL